MPPATATCRNAITYASRLNGSFLSFLYCTRTIRGQHDSIIRYHDVDDGLENRRDEPPQFNHSIGQRQTKSPHKAQWSEEGDQRSNDLSRGLKYERATQKKLDLGKEQRSSFRGELSEDRDALSGLEISDGFKEDNKSRDAIRRHHDSGRHHRQQRTEWVDHVPFERLEDDAEVEEILDGTTITPAERKVFERLKAMKPAEPMVKEIQPRDEGAPLADAVIRHVASKEEVFKGFQENFALRKAIEADLNRVESLMQDAQTDVDLWRIFQEQVISRVIALELDPPKNDDEKRDRKKARQRKMRATAKKAGEAHLQTPEPASSNTKAAHGVTDKAILTESLPKHVLGFFRHYRHDFPSSNLPPSLVPYLKSLGPMTFAMAASTTLYNNHMRWLFRRYLDLPAIISTLEEMDKNVYEFDNRTADLIAGILKRRSWAASYGNLGESAKLLWSGQSMTASLKTIRRWRLVVTERLQRKALREARAKEEVAGENSTTPESVSS